MFQSPLYLILFLLSAFSATFVLTWIVRRVAIRKSIIDLPNERSLHVVPKPRGGGIAIVLIWFLAITILFFTGEISSNLYYALLCGLPISIVGFIDDLITISARVRFVIQVISSIFVLYVLGGLSSVNFGFDSYSLPYIFPFLAVLGLVWFTNLFNFLDGVDGYLSSGVVFIGTMAMLFLGNVPLLVLASIAGGFLLWNWQPARIFMGDVGSTLIGFTVGVFIVYSQKIGDTSIFVWLIITSLFWFDATLTLFRRWLVGDSLLNAHKKHASQRLVQAGFSHQKTVIYALILNISLVIFIWLAVSFPEYSGLILLINIAYFYIVVKWVDKKFPFRSI